MVFLNAFMYLAVFFARVSGVLLVLVGCTWGDTGNAVPRASCGPGSRAETVQGETTLAERFAAETARAYNCNLELVGQFPGEGAAGFVTTYEDCAFYSTWPNPQLRHPGVVVLDVANPRRPTATAYLDSPAMLNANESLVVDPKHALLFANEFSKTLFDVYDVSDCRRPVLKSSVTVLRGTQHTGSLAPDGRTLYATSCCSFLDQYPLDPSLPTTAAFAIDVSDTAHPHVIATWLPRQRDWFVHSLTVSKDGSRAYASVAAADGSVLAILDIADIRERRHDKQFKLIGQLLWHESNSMEFALPIEIRGHPYIVTTDINGTITAPVPGNKGTNTACVPGKPGWGIEHIVDIGDEHTPKVVSKLILEVSAPENCQNVMYDPTVSLGYGTFACSVDNDLDARLLACGQFEAGLRVFDIRQPDHPREVAYYKPPALRMEVRPGSEDRNIISPELKDHTADDVMSPVFRNGGREIWFMSTDNGFQVVRFTAHFRDTHRDLFAR